MDSYTSMVKKLTDTKLYSVRTGGRTYAELKAFATGLDLLFNELGEMLKEYFIDTVIQKAQVHCNIRTMSFLPT